MKSTVLIIDDSPTFREFLRQGLESAGYGVMTAETGEQGLSAAHSAEIDAFIVDNLLPGIDGASVVRRLRQQVRHRRTPSLLLTASDDPEQELNALEAGADAFVRKDQPIEVLLARLAAVLRSVGTPATAEAGQTTRRAPRILFLNGDVPLADQAARLLGNEGVSITRARTPQLPAGEFDCVVLGVREVQSEGATVRELRGRQRNGPPRLVLLGSSDERSELVNAIALGADDYLSWSAGEAVLTARIRAQVRRKQLEDENELARESLMRHRMELEAQKQMTSARAVVAEELRIARDLAETRARETEDLLAQSQAVFRSMTEGLAICDLHGRLVEVNDSALAIFAARDRQHLETLLQKGAGCEMRAPGGKTVPLHDWPLAMAMRGDAVSSVEMTFLRRDIAHSFIGSFSAVPVNNREGRRILAALTVRDITSQKRSEEVLRRTEQLAVTGRLAASIAHEINNPLAAVTNLLFLLKTPVEKDAQAAAFLAMAQKELQRVADITRQTLAFYRESSKPSEVDVCALAGEVMDLFNSKLRSAGVELEADLACDVHPLGFAGELRQVISNLVANAIEAAPVGSVVHMRVRAARERGVPGVRISIADRGMGIPRSFYPEMFKPFASLKGSHGTGLGLWVTQSIVARHEGRIRFRSSTSAPRNGTQFSVFIPRVPSMRSDRSDPVTELFRELGQELLARPGARAS